MGLPSEGMAFPLYEFFMNTAPWNKFDYFTGARGRDAPRRYNRDTTRQARVNWKRYHTHGAGEYNRARSLVVHQFPERALARSDPDLPVRSPLVAGRGAHVCLADPRSGGSSVVLPCHVLYTRDHPNTRLGNFANHFVAQ